MINRIAFGTYHVTIPKFQTWSLFQYIRCSIAEFQKRHNEHYIIIIYSEPKDYDMPDYYDSGEFLGMRTLHDSTEVIYNHAIFINTPGWRKLIYKATSKILPRFGESVHFCDSYENAVMLADDIRETYPADYEVRHG